MHKKQMMKAFVLFLLCLSICGCTSNKDLTNQEPITLMIWHYYNGKQKDAFDQLVNQFNETVGAKKGIVVSAESKGNVDELATAVVDSAAKKVGSDKLPDIFATYMDTALILYEEGLLVDISQYMKREELEEYIPTFLEEGRLKENELQVLPVAKSTELLYINITDWEKFAKETNASETSFSTWEGLAQLAEEYYRWSGGKAFFGRDSHANYAVIGSEQLGKPLVDIVNNQATIQLDEKVLHKLWDYYAVPYMKGYYGAYGRFRTDDLKTGDLIACVASITSVAYFPKEVTREDGSTYSIESKVFELPNFEGYKPYAVSQGAGMAVIHSTKSKERAAVEFLKWFTDVDQNKKFTVNSGYLPVKIDANKEENMRNALTLAGVKEGTIAYDSLMLGMHSITNVNLYNSKAFHGGIEARSIVTNYFTTRLDAYVEEIHALIQEGMSEEDAWNTYITEDLFQDWLSGFQKEFKSAL